jgi:glycosyltransferase involved in cell wall biosynthesis
MFIASLILVLIAGLASIPVCIFFIEVIAGLATSTKRTIEGRDQRQTQTTVVVIVPAHNESTGIIPTLEDIKPQLDKTGRLLVVADNCTDDTAKVAAAAGAEVIARNDPEKIGKGYALDWGIRHISANPPDAVIFIDADCRIQSDMIERLKVSCSALRRPVQACFLMKSPPNSPINHSFAEFAWLVKNWVRPLGLRSLNFPVQLMGTGMIFPWNTIRSASLDNGNIVEDLKLGLDLAAIGQAAQFFPFVVGTSYFPMTVKGTDTQRQRWESGSIGMIRRTAPRMFYLAITRRNLDLLVLTLDLIVPPLSLLGFLLVGIFVLTSLAALFGLSSAAMAISAANLLAFTFAIILAWLRFGRDILPARTLLSIGPYVFAKCRLYARILSGRAGAQWIRTDRTKS